VAEFQYNDKKHLITEYTPFELKYKRHPWKGDLIIGTELSKLGTFLRELKRS